jgi:putative ABC transport system permease protein
MNISLLGMVVAILMLALPLFVLYYFRADVLPLMLRSAGRMLVQLVLVAVYLRFLFEWNNAYVNAAWMLLMTGYTAYATTKRAHLHTRRMLMPVAAGLLASVVVTTLLVLLAGFGLSKALDTRYFVPTIALLLAGMSDMNATALHAFYLTARQNQQQYYYLLGNGATRLEAVTPFIGRALSQAFAPLARSMSLLAVTTLPFVLCGMLLGGADVTEAMKALLLFFAATFFAATLSTLTTLMAAARTTFNSHGQMADMLRGEKEPSDS